MKLHDTKWLSEQLSLSISTIEKLRSEQPDQLPKAIIINKSIRYCELHVHWWLQQHLHPHIPDFDDWLKDYYGQQRLVLKRPKTDQNSEEHRKQPQVQPDPQSLLKEQYPC